MSTSPFTILVDVNEKRPWRFGSIPGPKGQGTITVPWEWYNLGHGYGDYTIKGATSKTCRWRLSVERKSPSDLYGTVLSRRRQFVTELENLNKMEYAAVVVEANLMTILNYNPPYWDSQGLPKEARMNKQRQVLGSIQAWQLRYPNIRWWFLPRKYCPIWVYRLLNRFWMDKMQVPTVSRIQAVRRFPGL